MRMTMTRDECEHGVEGFCMLCCREGENKCSPDDLTYEPPNRNTFPGEYDDEPEAP